MVQSAAATVIGAGHSCVRICYWFLDHLPLTALSSANVPLLTLNDGGFPAAPCLTMEEYIAAGGAIRDFFDLALHDHAVHGWPLTAERLGGELIYYQRLRGIAIKARNILRALAPDAIIVTHGAEPISRAISTESAALAIPVLLLESSFFPGFLALDVGGQHFFPKKSRLARTLPLRMAQSLSSEESARISNFLDEWLRRRASKYEQESSASELERVDRFVSDARGRVAFLPAQLSWDANVLPHLGEYATLWDLYRDVIGRMRDWRIVVKAHPMDTSDAVQRLAKLEHVLVVHEVSIHDLAQRCDLVVALSSNVGLEALMIGKPVVLLGRPYYANLGLTTDINHTSQLPEALQTASAPDRERLSRLLYGLAFEHLMPVGDRDRLNARLDEAKKAGPLAWRSLATLAGCYPESASAYLRTAQRYDALARRNYCDSEIRRELPELQGAAIAPAHCECPASATRLPIDFGEVEVSSLAFFTFAATALQAGSRVLHLDCGAGYGGVLLAETAASVDAVDQGDSNIRFAQQAWPHDRVRYHEASAGGWLSAAPAPYDAIVAPQTLEHSYDPKLFMSAAWSALKPGGALLLSTRNADCNPPLGDETSKIRRFACHDLSDLIKQLPNIQDHIVLRQHGPMIGSTHPASSWLVAIAVKSGGFSKALRSLETLLPFVMERKPERRTWRIGADQFSTNIGQHFGAKITYTPDGADGHIVFGPYRKFPAGSYRVLFAIASAADAQPGNTTFTFDVVNANDDMLGQVAFSDMAFMHTERASVTFLHAHADLPLEFRIHVAGAACGAPLVFTGVEVKSLAGGGQA